jgi:GYF domain 2
MNKCYYAGPDKKPVGPFTAEELRQLVMEGKINDNTFLIGEGQANWVRYADWQTTQGTTEAAEAIARTARQMKTAMAQFEFGSSFFGLLLVIVEIFVLPWRLIKGAACTLASWGSSRRLPTSQSDLPVATFITVVLRPAYHILLTVIGGLVVIAMSLYDMFSRDGSFSEGVKILIGGIVAIYFANLIVGAIFDGMSILVQTANSLRNIERK